jgi:prepilin-type N-terminal cleavage/methylation domain-containing protein
MRDGQRMRVTRHDGFTLIEAIFALTILAIVAAGVIPMGLIATKATENQGHLGARTTEYAQDKLEQLMVLSWGDSTTDTRVSPMTDTGGTGLTAGGSSDPSAPTAKYVDYLDINGNLIPAGNGTPNDWFYKRVWRVSVMPAPQDKLKLIEVSATVRVASQGGIGEVPRSTVSAVKAFPF